MKFRLRSRWTNFTAEQILNCNSISTCNTTVEITFISLSVKSCHSDFVLTRARVHTFVDYLFQSSCAICSFHYFRMSFLCKIVNFFYHYWVYNDSLRRVKFGSIVVLKLYVSSTQAWPHYKVPLHGISNYYGLVGELLKHWESANYDTQNGQILNHFQ